MGVRLFATAVRRYVFVGVLLAVAVVGATQLPVHADDDDLTSDRERLVTIHDHGQKRTIVTKVRTVRQVLRSLDIPVDEARDVVEPHIDMALSGAKYEVNIFRARSVTVVDAGRRVRVVTAEQTPVRIAKAAGVTLYAEDTVVLSSSHNLLLDGVGMIMNIERAPQRTVTEEVEIDFPVEQVQDSTKPIGFKEITTRGEKGIRKVTYHIEARQGVEVARREVASEVVKQPSRQVETIGTKPRNPLTKSRGAHVFTDSKGVAHRETYYDLPMNIVMKACGGGSYTVRADGAKVDKDGYILVAAHLGNYPRCSVVETSMGPGKVYDTGGFAKVHPHAFDLATDWTNGDGR